MVVGRRSVCGEVGCWFVEDAYGVFFSKSGKSGRMKTGLEIVVMGSCAELQPHLDYRRRPLLLPSPRRPD